MYCWFKVIDNISGCGPMEIIATTNQEAILLLFNASKKLSYSNIMTHLNFSNEETARLLYSLACDKYTMLLKKPDITTIGDYYFKINFNFTDRTWKVKIPMPMPMPLLDISKYF